MPRFDYKQARADGVSDQQIDQFLAERKAAGEDWWIDKADLAGAKPDYAAVATSQAPALRAAGGALGLAARRVVAVASAMGDMASQGLGGAIRATRGGVPPLNAVGLGTMQAGQRGAEHVGSWFGQSLPPQDTTTLQQFNEMGYTESPIPEPVALAMGKTGTIARALTSPEAAAIAAEYAATLPVDAAMGVGLKVAKPVLSAATEPLRQVPGIKQTGNFFSRGFSIKGGKERQAFRELIDDELGREALENAAREERLAAIANLSDQEFYEITKAIETKTTASLPANLRQAADAIQAESVADVATRKAHGLKPNELGAHIAVPTKSVERKAYRVQLAREQQKRVSEAAEDNPFLSRPTYTQGLTGHGATARLRNEPPLSRRVIGPQPPPRELPEIQLTHPPYEAKPNIRPQDAERAASVRRLEEEGMIPPRIQDALRKRRGAEADARALAEQGFEGPEELGHSMFRSTETYVPTPRPKFGQPPKPPKKKPTPEIDAMLKAAPGTKEAEEKIWRLNKAAQLRAERGAARYTKAQESELRAELHKWEKRTKRKVPRTAEGLIDLETAPAFVARESEKLVAFAPSRVITPKTQRLLGPPGKRYGAPSGLSTKSTGRRTSDPFATTEEVVAALRRKNPKLAKDPVFRNVVEGALVRGEQTSRATAHARIVSEAVKRFKSTAPDAVEVTGKDGLPVLSGFTAKARKGFEGAKVDKEVFRALKDLDDALRPEHYSALGNAWRSSMKGWKALVTTINPQFASRNMQWNVLIGFARGNRDPRNWSEAASILGGADDTRTLLGTSYRKLREEMIEDRITGAGLFTEFAPAKKVAGEGKVKGAIKAPFRVTGQANQRLEDLSRASFYLAKRKAGLSRKEAAREVARTYFNYNRDAFTRGENFLRGNLIPFYSWMRRIVPLYGRTLFETPSLHVAGGSLQKNLSAATPEDLELMPDVAENLGIVQKPKPGQKPDEKVITQVGGLQGFQQVNAIAGDRGRGLLRNAVDLVESSVFPPIGVGLQALDKRNAFFGSDFTGSPKKLPLAAKPLAYVPAIKNLVKVRPDGSVYGPEWLELVIRAGGPPIQVLDDAPKAAIGDKAAEARIVRWLTGVSTQVRDLSGARRARQFERREEAKKPQKDERAIRRSEQREEQKREREERLFAE